MSSAIMSLLISHILTFVESELANLEPTIIADVQALISKLEALIAAKVAPVAQVAAPVVAQPLASAPLVAQA